MVRKHRQALAHELHLATVEERPITRHGYQHWPTACFDTPMMPPFFDMMFPLISPNFAAKPSAYVLHNSQRAADQQPEEQMVLSVQVVGTSNSKKDQAYERSTG